MAGRLCLSNHAKKLIMDSAPGTTFPIIFARGVQTLTSGRHTFVISSVANWGWEPAATAARDPEVTPREIGILSVRGGACQLSVRNKKGGVANRPSPQSPKGILGSPPPPTFEVQAPGQF